MQYPTMSDIMKKTFIESSRFTNEVGKLLDDDSLYALQNELMQDPERGAVMPDCGGLRKLRAADSRKRRGKRGGSRVIYLHVPEVDWIYLLDIYGKGEQEDLTPDEKKTLRRLAKLFKNEAIRTARTSPRETER